MNKIKKNLLILKNIPNELYNLFFKKTLFSFILIVFIICISLYSKSLVLIVCAIFAVITILLMIGYEYYVITKNKLLWVCGICTDIEKKYFISNKSSYNSIIIETDNYTYKCNIPQNNIKQFKIGKAVSIYTTKHNIYQDNSGLVIISYPLYVIPYI